MLDKINFFAQTNPAQYNYRVNTRTANETISNTLKESKPKNAKFDWLNIEDLMEFVQKTDELKKIVLKDSLKKCAPGTRETMRNHKIEKEKEHIAKPISERTVYNTKQLRAAGVKDGDVNKYLTYDGHVTNEGKKILHEHGKSYK